MVNTTKYGGRLQIRSDGVKSGDTFSKAVTSYQVRKYTDTDGSLYYTVEAAVTMPAFVQEDIKNGRMPVISVGNEHRHNDTTCGAGPKYNMISHDPDHYAWDTYVPADDQATNTAKHRDWQNGWGNYIWHPDLVLATANDSVNNAVVDANKTYSTAIKVSTYNKTSVNVTDGVLDASYNESSHVVDTYQAVSKEGTSFDVYFQNDNDYLYFYARVDLPTGATTAAANGNDMFRIYFDFLNNHTNAMTDTTAGKSYTTDHVKKSDNVYGCNGGQISFTANGGVSLAEGFSLPVVAKSAKTFYETIEGTQYADYYVIEAQITLPAYIAEDLAAGRQPMIGIGYQVRNNNAGEAAKNYNMFSHDPYLTTGAVHYAEQWSNYTVFSDVVLCNATNANKTNFFLEEDKTVANVLGDQMIIDGEMGAAEGWNANPYFALDTVVKDKTDNGLRPYVRYSTDGEFLYVFYESVQMPKWAQFYVSFDGTQQATSVSAFEKARGEFIVARIYMDDASNNVWNNNVLQLNTAEETDGHFAYNGTSYTEPLSYMLYGAITGGNDDSIKGHYSYTSNDDIGARTVIARNDAKTCLEMKIPLSESVKSKLETGDATIYVNAIGRHNGDTAQYAANEGVNADNSFKWSAPIAITLPKTPDTAMVGLQTSDISNGTYDMRFSAVMSKDYTNYKTAGFNFKYVSGPDADLVGKTSVQNCSYVYTAINADGVKVSASTYGGDYFFCYTINDLIVGQTYSFEITPFVTVDGETQSTSSTVTLTFSVDASGKITFQ